MLYFVVRVEQKTGIITPSIIHGTYTINEECLWTLHVVFVNLRRYISQDLHDVPLTIFQRCNFKTKDLLDD